MTIALPLRPDAGLRDQPDVDIDRLSYLMEQVDRLAAQLSDAGTALRSLVDGRRPCSLLWPEHEGVVVPRTPPIPS